MQLYDPHRLVKSSVEDALTEHLRFRIGSTGRFLVIDKSRQEQSLKQLVKRVKKESYKACYDTSCQIPLGMALAADAILRVSVSRFGDVYTVNLELIDLAREASIATATADCDGSAPGLKTALEAAVKVLVKQL